MKFPRSPSLLVAPLFNDSSSWVLLLLVFLSKTSTWKLYWMLTGSDHSLWILSQWGQGLVAWIFRLRMNQLWPLAAVVAEPVDKRRRRPGSSDWRHRQTTCRINWLFPKTLVPPALLWTGDTTVKGNVVLAARWENEMHNEIHCLA